VSSSGLALIYLKQALRQPGCPVCRCCLDQETRYLRFLLWENVNDVETRVRMAQSLGFCGRHARQLWRMEQEELGMMLGNSIIYESMVQLALYKIADTRSLMTEQRASTSWVRTLLGRLGLDHYGRPPNRERFLVPNQACRVCELGEEAAAHYGDVLADLLSQDEFQDMYKHSDGVCLPHLRVMLQCAQSEAGLEYLIRKTEERLERLGDDLRGVGRKYSVSHGGESFTTSESLSVERAIAFLTGSVPSQVAGEGNHVLAGYSCRREQANRNPQEGERVLPSDEREKEV